MRTLIAQCDGDGGEGKGVGNGKHGVVSASSQDAELESGGKHLGTWCKRGMVERGGRGAGGIRC